MDNSLDEEVIGLLEELNNPQTLLALTIDLQTQDQQNGTHNFDLFKASIISLDPTFRDKIPETETKAKLAL
ncbi:hypothetical protein AGMMS50256_36810 [Betaproteobacteria bacterium]|nr:hypothetical protein AGMMS50256_36810 [Betaproteobacteria bacterium]